MKIGYFLLLILVFMPAPTGAVSFGIVSDIHAGNKELVSNREESWYYPAHYCENLDGVKKSGVDYILTLGDNTLNGKESEAEKIIRCLNGYNVIWTKGNHDKEVAWKYFNTPNYYSMSFGKWKLIVLDSSKKDPGGAGGFYGEQLLWLEKELACSDNVVIAMHHNIFQYKPLFPNLSEIKTIFPSYPYSPIEILKTYPQHEAFKDMLDLSGKVRYVYFGHVHGRSSCYKVGEINYCSIPALSLKGNEGYFSVLNLE